VNILYLTIARQMISNELGDRSGLAVVEDPLARATARVPLHPDPEMRASRYAGSL
jgi:hypothetical protein